jgi:hypothetical protein
VITAQFDIYFHLWSNGTPHWEREIRAWEIEQEKEWTRVMSKDEKWNFKKQSSCKRVCYSEHVTRFPFDRTPDPSVLLQFGTFTTRVNPENSPLFNRHVESFRGTSFSNH